MKGMTMTSKPGLLARMLGRGSRAPVVASLAAAVLNQPLLVQPTIGEALVGGYLEGKVTSDDSVLKADRFEVSGADGQPVGVAQKLIGVINLSGAMVNRPMPGASGPGPVSYAAVRDTFDELLNDDAVTSIILRLDTPGGMASGCFDLVDHIYQARGRKPVYALVDDHAYSAGFALASACDEIWISRTGGVGSVGVVRFHHDWSGNNAQIGLKVTRFSQVPARSTSTPTSPSARKRTQRQWRIWRTCTRCSSIPWRATSTWKPKRCVPPRRPATAARPL